MRHIGFVQPAQLSLYWGVAVTAPDAKCSATMSACAVVQSSSPFKEGARSNCEMPACSGGVWGVRMVAF